MEAGQQLQGVLECELARSHLGHRARDKRLLRVAKSACKAPAESIPQQFYLDEAGLKGAYRFFSNEKVTAEAILSGHVAATRDRCSQSGRVLAVQDTTSLVFEHEVQGAGRINQFKSVKGLWVHSTLALDEVTHEVRGVLGQMVWARPEKKKRKETGAQRKKRPRESLRWAEAACQVADVFSQVPEQQRPHVVHVLDSEGDIFETLEVLQALGDSFVIRATRERLLAPSQQEHAEQVLPRHYLLDTVEGAPVLGHKVVQVPRRPGQLERQATLDIRACRVQLMPPRNRGRAGLPLTLNVVLAQEAQPPAMQKPLRWCLLTDEPIDTLPECLAVVRTYEGRWLVEELHMGFKTGCGSETRQLKNAHRLTNFLALASVMAFGMLALRDAARRPNPPPASEHLSEVQLALLGQLHPGLPPAPNAYEALRAMARVGGFIGRKGDGEPGWRTLWRGWEKLLLAEVGYRLALQQPPAPPPFSG
jgi:Transposase DNA-binding/Transposase Tn5 dimerisation domain